MEYGPSIRNLFLVVKFDDDKEGDYWAVPFTSVDSYSVWVNLWKRGGGVQSMADNVCVVFNGVGDIPLDLSSDPLGTRKCPKCTRKPMCCLRSAKVAYGPRENLCCVLLSYERRVTGYDREKDEAAVLPTTEEQERRFTGYDCDEIAVSPTTQEQDADFSQNQQNCIKDTEKEKKASKKRNDFHSLCNS
ncbi:uncharacterized protein LOC127749868 [Frankliniella occidentalis]|uniref:Uncharacterized protein LOC127749868 n=1 Tax=Frankliniella occidentalis TaxID=133901 RepID=A0A9C6UBL8_FRAOC|nr:uncharacterized protein LOC127749868 [Frankliniella occidentalis]